ncbi:MAG: glycosyltransferase family 4 protein [Clostridiales bacterium]|nr:glycosyltransferase family 4 protein [Clostridiales bacterium]
MIASSGPRSVLHLTDYGAPYEGNFIASLRALERLLAEQGTGMTYVFPRRAADRDWVKAMMREKDNVRCIENDGFFAYARQIRRLLRESGAEVLHAHFIHFSEKLAALYACRTCGRRVRTVLHLHNHIELPKNALRHLPHRLYFRAVSRFVCCSRSVAEHLIADGVPRERVTVAENAIAFARLDTFDPGVRAALHLPQNTKLALMFGYNYEVKGVDLAVEAVRLLRERTGAPVSLAVVLSSRLDEVRRRICAQLSVSSLPDWVLLLPPREDVASYYHMADVFLSPSRQEGFCYALVEAAYCRTPVLASAIDAQRDLALPQSAFFPPCDPAALSAALERVLSEPDPPFFKDALEETGRAVTDAYSLAHWARTVADAYNAIL